MKGFSFSTLFGALALSVPAALLCVASLPAQAQLSTTDSTYINELFTFLEERDTVTYNMATEAMSPEDSIWAAQMFCQTFESGVSPEDAFSVYTTSAISQATSQGVTLTEEMAFAVGLYGGAVMNLGAAHYCPQHQPSVAQALNAL